MPEIRILLYSNDNGIFYYTVMIMGFGEREGRLGLRATGGDVTKAIQHIIEKRKVRKWIAVTLFPH